MNGLFQKSNQNFLYLVNLIKIYSITFATAFKLRKEDQPKTPKNDQNFIPIKPYQLEMQDKLKLYMIMLGCKPEGRYTEQHDIFFMNWQINERIDSRNESILV